MIYKTTSKLYARAIESIAASYLKFQ